MHLDPELLSLLALGEHAGTEDERSHARLCAKCARELSQLRQVVAVARATGVDNGVAKPAPAVWDRIREQLGLATASTEAVQPSLRAAEEEPTRHAWLRPVGEPWSGAEGEARVAIDEGGRRIMEVALQADLPTSGLRQAWLVHREDPVLRQTLGVLDGSLGLWTVDRSIDLQTFALLEISQQDVGQIFHSGQTIVRGALTVIG